MKRARLLGTPVEFVLHFVQQPLAQPVATSRAGGWFDAETFISNNELNGWHGTVCCVRAFAFGDWERIGYLYPAAEAVVS